MFAIAREKKNAKQRKKNGHFPRETKKLCGNHHLQQRQKLRKICGTTQNTYNLLRSAVSIVTFTRKKKREKNTLYFLKYLFHRLLSRWSLTNDLCPLNRLKKWKKPKPNSFHPRSVVCMGRDFSSVDWIFDPNYFRPTFISFDKSFIIEFLLHQ